MDWQAALLARLRAAAGVTALIGARSYWEEAPQGTARPFVTLYDLTPGRSQHLKGFNLEASRVQIDVWTDGVKEKTTIMEAVLAALVPGVTTGGHKFQRADVALGPRDMPPERVGEATVRRKSADLIIHHKPA
jgi:hypothetical protein